MSEKGPSGGFPRSEKEKENERNGTSRRNFLVGAAALLGTASLPSAVGKKERPDEAFFEDTPAYTNSEYFRGRIDEIAKKYEAEIDAIERYAFAPLPERDKEKLEAMGVDSSESVIVYAWNNIDTSTMPKSLDEEECKWLIMGLLCVESRFDPTRQSPDGARGIAMFMEDTMGDVGIKEEDAHSVVEHVRAVSEYFKQMKSFLYNGSDCEDCKQNLEHIERELFGSNTAEFERHFLMPFLINTFNTGMGNMAKVLRWYVKTYGTQDQRAGSFNMDMHQDVSGHDAFLLLADGAYLEEPVDAYKHEASSYTTEVYAAAKVLKERFGKQNAS